MFNSVITQISFRPSKGQRGTRRTWLQCYGPAFKMNRSKRFLVTEQTQLTALTFPLLVAPLKVSKVRFHINQFESRLKTVCKTTASLAEGLRFGHLDYPLTFLCTSPRTDRRCVPNSLQFNWYRVLSSEIKRSRLGRTILLHLL